MQDMVAKIISMDQKEREITSEAEFDLAKYEEEIKLYKETVRSEYLGRARKRIEKNKVKEQEKAENLLKLEKKKFDKYIKSLDNVYQKNNEAWIDEIVKRTL